VLWPAFLPVLRRCLVPPGLGFLPLASLGEPRLLADKTSYRPGDSAVLRFHNPVRPRPRSSALGPQGEPAVPLPHHHGDPRDGP